MCLWEINYDVNNEGGGGGGGGVGGNLSMP